MATPATSRSRGFTLLEVLVAMLIVAFGALGLVGLQAVSAKGATDARYRTEAEMLINQLLGKMWVTDRVAATMQTNFASAQGGAGYTAWLADVSSMLPGVVAGTATAPVVAVNTTAGAVTEGTVTVTVYWTAPSEAAAAAPHSLTTIAQIR